MQKSSKKNSYEPDLYKIGVIFCFISILWLGIFENPSTRDLIYEVKGKSEEQSIRIKELEKLYSKKAIEYALN